MYRFGDQLGAWSTAFFQGHNVDSGQVALIAVPLSVLWLLDSLWLGRQQKRLAEQATVPAPDRPSNKQAA